MSAHAAICAAIRAIAPGQTRSYAAIARTAGLPGRARLVVRVLKTEDDLPWHRVVKADGRIAFPRDSEPYLLQLERLTGEGATVRNGRVIALHIEADGLDATLWG